MSGAEGRARFVVQAGFATPDRATVAAGQMELGEIAPGDVLEWVRGGASRRTRCLGVAVIREDPPRDPELTGIVLEAMTPADLQAGDVLRTPDGVASSAGPIAGSSQIGSGGSAGGAEGGGGPSGGGPSGGTRGGGLTMAVDGPELNVFDAVGGRPFFDRLIARFYAGIEGDPVVRPLYPDDLTDSITNTAGFLAQYWGGGTAHYSDDRGHPRLRKRHGHVAIGQVERDRWVHHMTEALHAEHLAPDLEAKLLAYFEMGATAMINAPG